MSPKLFGVLALVVVASSVVAGPPKKGPPVPPEIQAILDKKKHGGALTMDDIKKLQDWAAGVQAHLPVPQTSGVPGVPDAGPPPVRVRFDVDVHYTRKTSDGIDTYQLTASAPANLTAKINGTDDWMNGSLDPSAKISSFLFQSGEALGTGSFRYHHQGKSTVDLAATMSRVAAGAMFVTVGGDTLGIIPGRINGEVRGTYHSVDESGKSHTSDYDGAMREALVDLVFPWEGHVTKDRTKPTPHPRAQVSYTALVAAVHSSKPMPIHVNEHFDWNDHGEQVDGDESLTITINPSDDNVEARIVADTKWDAWIPMGPTPSGGRGNTFKVHLDLVDTKTGKTSRLAPKVVKASYELDEVSNLPGACTNWPQPGKAGYETKPDLFFADANKVGTAKDAERQTFELGKTDWNKPVLIESRDWGGFGKVAAHVTLDDGTMLAAKFEPNGTAYLPLPKDDDHNHLADAWAPGKDLDPAADDEDVPSGFRTRGDGLTVMEEYRGFFVAKDHTPIGDHVAEDHVRFDPKVRELIVAIETTDAKRASQVKRGIALFESASDIAVYAVATGDRMGPHARDYGRPRAVVFNVAPPGAAKADASREALGVWISDQVEQPDGAVARTWPYHDGVYCDDHAMECMHAPDTIKYVALNKGDEGAKTVNWIINMVDPDPMPDAGPNTKAARADVDAYYKSIGVKDADRRAAVVAGRANMPALADEMATFAIAHELGHVIGAQHHGVLIKRGEHPEIGVDSGDENCPMRYWQVLNEKKDDTTDPAHPKYLGLWSPPINAPLWLRFLKGQWNPAVTGPSKPWRIDRLIDMGFDP